jgi:hypothetical protein
MTTDVIISCHCRLRRHRGGRHRPKYKHISRLPSPLHEQAIHHA